MKFNHLLCVCALLLFSCKEGKPLKVEPAFYYWKSGYSYINNNMGDKLNTLGVKKLYHKVFEVDYNDAMGNFPYSKSEPSVYHLNSIDSLEIVPVVFVKNEIFQYNNKTSLDKLADDIVYLVDKYIGSKSMFIFNELQIDCDWTKSTKDNYFYLLKKIKELSGKKLSCTLRLYPYKYPDIMGVPPVDKATLMCYNLIQPLSQQHKNSILDIKELEKYLTRKDKYPVHLDIALPVFFWSQWYQNNQFVKLLDKSSTELADFTKQTEPMWYEVTEDTSLDYYNYLRVGDRIKCEEVSAEDIHKALKLIKEKIVLEGTVTVTLFDLDQSTFNTYSDEELHSFYSGLLQ